MSRAYTGDSIKAAGVQSISAGLEVMPQQGEQPEFGFVYPNPPFSQHFKQNIWGAFVMLAAPSNSSDFLSFKLKINKRHREHKVCL